MVRIQGIEVSVLVNGIAAQEYESRDEEEEGQGTHTVTRYIEAVSGAEFAVQYEIRPDFSFNSELLRVDVLIDGKYVDGFINEKVEFQRHARRLKETSIGAREVSGGKWTLQKFKFSVINTS